VRDSPLYGAERGAPVVAFARFADAEPIAERGYIESRDAVVVMDDSLLAQPDAGVLDGVREGDTPRRQLGRPSVGRGRRSRRGVLVRE
jgi:Pyruvate/2-oxoacid:ferredoxin oxidoreductase gamma subunit